ncbi:MAG TPA: tripartite tricarboxylate transporter TctB family protein [Burkholderiales bacterium]|nr:tripartite tricarboxylate transporter TctB family protein [Burkholderiales bacterium]
MEEQNESSGAAGAGISTRTAEIIVALIFLLLGGMVVFDSFRLGAGWSPDGPQAGYFPFYVGAIICISSLVVLGQTFFGRAKHDDRIFVEWPALRQVLSVLLPAAVYVVGIQLFGIYLSSAVYIAAFMIWLGNYGWLKSIVLGVAVSAIGFMMFEVWFQVPLYKGIFEPLSFLGY